MTWVAGWRARSTAALRGELNRALILKPPPPVNVLVPAIVVVALVAGLGG